MAKKNENSTEQYEVPNESGTYAVDVSEPAEQAEKKPAEREARIWVYLGPSIRGVVTNGKIFSGTKSDVVKLLENGIKAYPQIERLIVADKDVARARNDLVAKRGVYIPYAALVGKITGKEG